MKINNIGVHLPLLKRIKVRHIENDIKSRGYKNIETAVNKNGDVAVLVYSSPAKDELLVADILKRDGKEQVKCYKKSEKEYGRPNYRVIETWDKVKNNLIFNKSVTLQYKHFSSIPEVISTTYTDKDGSDGVEIVRKFPYKEYEKCFQRPQE